MKIRAKDYGLFIELPNGDSISYCRESGECQFVTSYNAFLGNVQNIQIESLETIISYKHENKLKQVTLKSN